MTDFSAKTFYIPYVSDHMYVAQAALAYFGMEGEVLPLTDDASAATGMGLVLGRECTPCLLVAGDVIRRFTQPGFSADRAVLLISSADGPCRYGQYTVLMRHILDEHGFNAVEIAYPSANNSYQGFGDRPQALRRLLWTGLVAVDLLQQLLYRYRPYEETTGQADALYAQGLKRIVAAVRQGGKGTHEAVRWCGSAFAKLAIRRDEVRPVIGVVGEVYARLNPYANQSLIRQIEELGGEVQVANLMEWFYYTNWWCIHRAKIRRDYRTVVVTKISDLYQRLVEFRLAQPVAHLLRHPHETATADLMQAIKPYFDPAISTEAVLTLGKAIDLARSGASGILNVMPFSCMPGIVSAGIAPRIRRDYDNIPWLDLSYDLQKTTNIQTRLEAFLYQATHYQRRRITQKEGAAVPA